MAPVQSSGFIHVVSGAEVLSQYWRQTRLSGGYNANVTFCEANISGNGGWGRPDDSLWAIVNMYTGQSFEVWRYDKRLSWRFKLRVRHGIRDDVIDTEKYR